MAANDAQPPANGTQDAPEFTGKLIDLQQQDLQLRRDQLAFEAKQSEIESRLALASIEANAKDAQSHREYLLKLQKNYLYAAAFGICLILVFCCCALFLGKEAVVLKLGEILALFLAGFVGGYGFKSSRSGTDRSEDSRD